MSAIGYQVIANVLTNPPSYTARVVPNSILGYDEVAAQINLHNPTIPVGTAKTVLEAFREEVKLQLANGNTVNLSNFVSFVTTMPVKLVNATDPLPSNPINISAKPATPFKDEIRAAATYTRLATEIKAPSIASAFDTVSAINGFVRNGYGLRISGTNLRFDQADVNEGVFLLSSAGNDVRQDNISLNDPSNLIVIPGLDSAAGPAGTASVEHSLSVKSRYTDNGQIRTGTYGKKLRSPNVISDATSDQVFVCGAQTSGPAKIKTYTGAQVTCRLVAQIKNTGELTLSVGTMAGVFGQQMTVTAAGDFVLAGLAANVTVEVTDYQVLYDNTMAYSRYLQEVCVMSPLT